jgi:ferredoxin
MSDFREKEFGELKIRIDRETCIATGNCIKVAPEVFEFDDEKITSFKLHLEEIDNERLIEACSVCPVDALSVFKDNGEQIVP